MSDRTNAHNLDLHEDQVVWVVATNDEQSSLLDPLPDGAAMTIDPVDNMDAAIIFVEDRDALTTYVDEVLPQLGSTPVVWIAFPGSSPADVDRESIEATVSDYGWTLANDVTLGDIWSAVRLQQV